MSKQLQATASLITVTPELASEWLADKWGEQRTVRSGHVEKLRLDMANKRWRVSPDAILRIKGKLANGQHRLAAVIDYGKPVQFLVMESNDDELYKVVDSGLRRTAADSLIGSPYYKCAPSIARWVIAYDANAVGRSRDKKPTTQAEMIDYCQKNMDELSEAAAMSYHLYCQTKLLPASIGGALYVIGKRAGELAKTKAFLEAVYSGEGNGSDGGSREYRNRLISNRGAKAKLYPAYLFALGIKALKCYLTGSKTGNLKWADDEELPRI